MRFPKIQSLLLDVRFWIILFLVLRLVGITDPPVESSNNWRQTTVTMVARNFAEVDNNILYPRIDIAGEKSGITGMEFPLFNYLIYLVSEVFGYQHWYGRLINLLVSSLGIWFFHRLLRKYWSPQVALYASLMLLVSVWLTYSRKIMPDTFAASLILASIYFGTNYLERNGQAIRDLLLYGVLIMLGLLSKLPVACMLFVLGIFAFRQDIPWSRKFAFAGVSLLAVLPASWWYFQWSPYLTEHYGFQHFFSGKSLLEGAQDLLANLPRTARQFYDKALKWSGLILFLVGTGFAIFRKDKGLLAVFGLSSIGFLVIMLKGGDVFYRHSYYMVPYVPVMALMGAYAISQVNKSWVRVLLLAVVLVEGVAGRQHDFHIKDKRLALVELEADLDQFSAREDLVAINSGLYPTPMYFAHRKGWVATNEELSNAEFRTALQQKGLRYIIILKQVFAQPMDLPHEVVLDNPHYRVYRLE